MLDCLPSLGKTGSGEIDRHQAGVAAAAAEEAASKGGDASLENAVLPNVVGAGGFADFLPLLAATIGM